MGQLFPAIDPDKDSLGVHRAMVDHLTRLGAFTEADLLVSVRYEPVFKLF